MARASLAGAVYFLIVFAAAFALGVLRTLWLSPLLGEGLALAIELPIVLFLSWTVCRRLIAAFDIADRIADRFAMGAVAFAFLMVAESTLSTVLLGRSLEQHLASYATWLGATGFSAQIVFAALPLVVGQIFRRP
jgi:hypothetical protein